MWLKGKENGGILCGYPGRNGMEGMGRRKIRIPVGVPCRTMSAFQQIVDDQMAAMQLDPVPAPTPVPSEGAHSGHAQAGQSSQSPTAPKTNPQSQTGLSVLPPLVEEEGLVIVDEPEKPYGPPTVVEWEAQEPELEEKYIFPRERKDSMYNYIICENCGGLWFRIGREGMDRMMELKKERNEKQYRFEHECLHCGGKEKSYHRVGGRREYYGWHIVGGKSTWAYAGPRPDVDPGWVHTMGTLSLRWYTGPYKFWFQVECLLAGMHRYPKEQEEYIQELKWKKTLWEEELEYPSPMTEEEAEALENIVGEEQKERRDIMMEEAGVVDEPPGGETE